MKRIYLLAWLMLAIAAAAGIVSGTFDALAMVVLGLFALALVQGLALWSIVVNTRDVQTN